MSDWKPPDIIWLQPEEYPEATWCINQINETDIQYTRTKIVKQLRAELDEVKLERNNLKQQVERRGKLLAELTFHIDPEDKGTHDEITRELESK